MFLFDCKNDRIIPLKVKTLSELGFKEVQDLQRWVRNNVSSFLKEDLLVISCEISNFDKSNERIDVLAIDRDKKVIIIELKRDTAPKLTDLQALHYASPFHFSPLTFDSCVEKYIIFKRKYYNEEIDKQSAEKIINTFLNEKISEFDNKPRIILLANNFREETITTIMYLRILGADIKCIKLDIYEFNEELLIFNPQIIIPQPKIEDHIIKLKAKNIEISERGELIKNYHMQLFPKIDGFKELTPSHVVHQGFSKDLISYGYYLKTSGIIRLYTNITHFKEDDIEKNKMIFDEIEKRKDVIEEEFGYKLQWNRYDDRRKSDISYIIEDIDWRDRNTWSVLVSKHTGLQNKFNNILQPYFSRIITELRESGKI